MKKTIIFLLAVAIVFLLAISAVYRAFPLKYGETITETAAEYGLDRHLVEGLIYAESSFDSTAHSGRARGLMQLTDETADWIAGQMGIDYEYDMAEVPETNIKMGCYYLAYLINMYQDTETALAAYNGGMGNVSKWLSDSAYSADGKTLYKIPYAETEKYVERVRLFTYIYSKLYR